MIRATNLRLDTPPLRGVSVATKAKVTGLVGPNGSGKTTLLRTVIGEIAAEGSVSIDDVPLSQLSRKAIARKVAMVVQEADAGVPMTVGEVVSLGRTPHSASIFSGIFSGLGDEDIIIDALHTVGIEHLARRDMATLSGGERQRAYIARALAQRTPYLLMDEPTNHLDIRYQHEILSLIRDVELTTLVVLHDLNLAAQYCDYVYLMNAGAIVAEGSPADVFTPENLEPVYDIPIQRVTVEGRIHLLFN